MSIERPMFPPSNSSRRTFLAGLATTVPIAATAATSALAAAGASRDAIDELYAERTELAVRSRALREQWEVAEARMPWWAQIGPSRLRGDGEWEGTDVGWPAVDDNKLPSSPGCMFNKRPSPWDIRREFKNKILRYGEKYRPEYRAQYRQQMRNLVERLRRQREEKLRVGLPAIEQELDAIGERIGEIDDRLENLEVEPADAPQKAAALLLIASNYDRDRDDSFGASATLDALRPLLTGQVREHANHAVTNPDDEMWSMPFWSAA
jgi:hypothetical protein